MCALEEYAPAQAVRAPDGLQIQDGASTTPCSRSVDAVSLMAARRLDCVHRRPHGVVKRSERICRAVGRRLVGKKELIHSKPSPDATQEHMRCHESYENAAQDL